MGPALRAPWYSLEAWLPLPAAQCRFPRMMRGRTSSGSAALAPSLAASKAPVQLSLLYKTGRVLWHCGKTSMASLSHGGEQRSTQTLDCVRSEQVLQRLLCRRKLKPGAEVCALAEKRWRTLTDYV